ncbi:hypothetical protein B0H11DRAFT_636472 [Mycena galericulata]|nr:hypothetical protein B0H11DRAFT_636472 [Mycena galericulata]
MSSNPGARATKHERATLMLTLADPMNPDACCVIGLRGILDKVLAKNPEDNARQGPILRAAMSFLSRKRSDEEHAAIRDRLLDCQCKPKIRALHRPVHRPLTEALELVLFMICGTISEYFMRLGPGKFRKPKENTLPEAQPWPCCIPDIIPVPRGEHDVLVGLVQWAANYPGGHSVFFLIGALARFWDPFALLVFQAPGVFLLATLHLQCALKAYDPHASSAVRINTFTTPVLACAKGFFHTLLEIDLPGVIQLLRTPPMVFEDLFAVAVSIEPILVTMREQMDDCRRWFHFVRGMNDASTFTKSPRGSAKRAETDFIGAYDRMVECLNIACTAETQGRSSVCSRCGIVRYCSRECLEAAWAAPRLPHKSLCKRIRTLRAAANLDEPKAWNHMMRDSALHRSPVEFIAQCVKHSVDPRLAEAIWRGISLLAHEKLRFSVEGNGERDYADGSDASDPEESATSGEEDADATSEPEDLPEEDVD